MPIDRADFIEDGFLILREVIPPHLLDPLRHCFESLVEGQKRLWQQERQPNDPPGGQWQTGAQPRLVGFESLIDKSTAPAVEFCLGLSTLQASQAIMGAPNAAPHRLMLMCSPQQDHGPAAWHRDIHPIDQAPLNGLQQDLLANGPGYLQWNIPLYDDKVLWVVPGSHRRSNTAAENAQLADDPRVPLPHSIPVELNAGDGVVYTNTILHWGSNYSTRTRRTIHLGYRSFGGPLYPYVPGRYLSPDYQQHLSPAFVALCQDHDRLYRDECDQLETFFRSVIQRDRSAFFTGLDLFHPGEENKIVAAIILSKLAYKLRFSNHPQRGGYGGDFTQDRELAPRFTADELERLWQGFAPLDALLQSSEEQFVPGFQSGPMAYYFEEMPTGLDLDSIVATW